MKTEQIILSVMGVAAVGAVAYIGWKKLGPSVAATAPSADVTAQPSAPPAFTATGQAYAPLPVGVSTDPNASAPPGVPAAQVNLPPADTGNASTPSYTDHTSALTSPGAASVAGASGLAAKPTDAVSSAPALTGNAAIVDAEYVHAFGRHADDAGLTFWSNAMSNGNVTRESLERELIKGAQGSDVSAAVLTDPHGVVAAYGK